MFRPAVIAAIKIKKIRHTIDKNAFVEHLFPEEVDALRSLPPLHKYSASSGYGRRTSGHGIGSISCRRQLQKLSSIVLKTTVTLILTMISGGMHHSGSRSPCHLIRGMNVDKPVKGPVWQTDEVKILLSEHGVHANRKY